MSVAFWCNHTAPPQAVRPLTVEIVRDWRGPPATLKGAAVAIGAFDGVHRGHRTLIEAVTRLRYEGRDVAWFPCAFDGADAHAGFTETSVLLHVSPSVVDPDRAVAGNREPVGALMGAMRSGGVAAQGAP